MGWTDFFRRKRIAEGIGYLISEDGFKCMTEDGAISYIEWHDLVWVKIFTTGEETVRGEDLYGSFANDQSEYMIPNCKDVHNIFPRLAGKLSGFDCDMMQEAMASVREKQYTCWKK